MKRFFNHYFPTPSYLAMNSFGVDISNRSIKYGELINTSHGISLGKYGNEKIPDGIVVSGKIEKEEELIKILKKIKDKEKFHFVRVSLPEEQVYLFTISVPKTENEKLRDVILLQIEEYIPLKAPDTVFDYDVIGEDDQNLHIEVVAVASLIIESYSYVFNKAGLVPLSFEVEAQSIARAVIPNGEINPVMVVDFGEARTGVSISQNGRVLLTTTLSIGGVDLTNMIAKTFSMTFDEAEKKKQEYGLNTSSKAEDIFPAILNGLSVLRDELNKQYIYWETHDESKNKKINHIILCGGDANLTGLSEYLELSMKIKVENANVWVNLSNNANLVPKMTFDESLGYATVVGLSLGDYLDTTQSIINVLPEEEKRVIRKEYWMRFFIIFMNLVALIGVFAVLLLFPSYFLSKLKTNLIEERIESFNKENSDLIDNNIDKIILDINSKLKVLNANNKDSQFGYNILNNLLSSRTEGIYFSQIFFNDKTVESLPTLELRGVATSRDALRNFKTALDGDPSYAEVNLPISDFLEKSNLDFTISIKIK